ncbi:MAG: hypothetical protein HFJ57_07955 [Clostridia bacterium]|nr:hypothetical protein [Clostridia bacterium]
MFNFIKKQKRKIIIAIISITMIITFMPFFSLATSDKEAPEIVANVKAGKIKSGTKLIFTITDESPISKVYYQWDRNIGTTVAKERSITGDKTSYTFSITVPTSLGLGLHEFSIVAVDNNNNIGSWLDVPLYVVDTEVPSTDEDKDAPQINPMTETGEYPLSRSTIDPGQSMKIRVTDNNDVYWFSYKWSRSFDSDYATGATLIYNPDEIITVTAPEEPGEWCLQFYARDCYNNISAGYYSIFTIRDTITSINFTQPEKTEYQYGEDLDLKGGKFDITRLSGKQEEISLTDEMVKNYDKTKLGKQELTVTYEGNTYTFTVNVIKAEQEKPEVKLDKTTVKMTEKAPVLTVSNKESAIGNITYTSSDENVATVDSEGNIELVGAGEFKITVSFEDTDYYNANSTETELITVEKDNLDKTNFEITDNKYIYEENVVRNAKVTLNVNGIGEISLKYYKVDETTGEAEANETINPINAGTYNVIAIVEDGLKYNGIEIGVGQLVIEKASQEIPNAIVTPNTVEMTSSEMPLVEVSNKENAKGTVSYSLDEASAKVIAINETTGEITSLLKAGTATIKVTFGSTKE